MCHLIDTTAAEELYFTRAAERIGIKQPPLSMQIRQIDRRWARLAFIAERAEAGALLLKGARKRPQGPKKR